MLSFLTILNKPTFKRPDGNTVLDLIQSTVVYRNEPDIKSMVIVADGFQMRPDLISGATLGDPNKADYILKTNGISNPFSIDIGDVLLIPDAGQMESSFTKPTVDPGDTANYTDRVSVNNDKTAGPKLPKDKLRLELMKKKVNKAQLLPPNVKKPEDQNIKYKDGQIIFGEDVTNYNKADCPVVLTRARVKERLLNKKIFS